MGSVIIHAPWWWWSQGTDSSSPNFSCIQNNYKYMKESWMLFPSIRKCHRDVTRSESGDDPRNSVRKGSWSTRKPICRPNSWEALNITGNKAKDDTTYWWGGNRIPGVPTVFFLFLYNSWTWAIGHIETTAHFYSGISTLFIINAHLLAASRTYYCSVL